MAKDRQFPKGLIAIKLGGSLITDKSVRRTVQHDVLSRLAHEIAFCARSGIPLLVAHGSGSFGHFAAMDYDVCTPKGASAIQAAAHELHAIVMAALRSAGVHAFSIYPASVFVDGEMTSCAPIERAISIGCIPILLGDVVMNEQGGAILSTEDVLLGAVRAGVPITKAIWLGNTNGVLDEYGETVPTISQKVLEQLGDAVGAAHGADVTGGMRHRVEKALQLAELGVTSVVCDGKDTRWTHNLTSDTQVIGTVVPKVQIY